MVQFDSRAAGFISLLLVFTVASAIVESTEFSSSTSSSTSDEGITEIIITSTTIATSTTTTLEDTTTTSTTIETPSTTSTTLEAATSTTLQPSTTLPSVTSSTVTSTTLILPETGSRLSADYAGKTDLYDVLFKTEPEEFSVEIQAYSAALKMKPIHLDTGSTKVEPSYDLRYIDEDNVEYKNIFSDGINIKYEIKEEYLKELITINEEKDLYAFDASPSTSSSTMGIGFMLIPSDNLVPSLDGKKPWDGNTTETTEDIYYIRKKTPGRLYATNRFFKIYRPYAVDSLGSREDLAYRLQETDGQTQLWLDFPVDWLNKAEYPVYIDPTIGMDGIDGWYRFINNANCSTAADDCWDIDDGPSNPSVDVIFSVDDGCTLFGDAKKDIFEFYTDELEYYDLDLAYATLYFEGDCNNIDELPNGYTLSINHIEPYVTSSPNCSDDPFSDIIDEVYELYGEGTSYACLDGSRSFSVTSIMQDAIDDNDDYLAFSLDMYPDNEWDDDPDPYMATYYIDRTSDDLYISYLFNCVYSNDCLNEEYCKKSLYYCYPDLEDGENCEDVAADDDDDACINEVCERDGFDDEGYFCSNGTNCVNDYELFVYGTWHCEGQEWAKQCGEYGIWQSLDNCSYGCTEGTGCNDQPPSIANQYPLNQANTSAGAMQEFNFSVWEGAYSLENVSLYMNLSSIWQIVNTTTTPSNGTVSLSYSVPLGAYIWGGEVYDNQGTTSISPQNYTLYATTTTLMGDINVSKNQITITVIK